MLKKRGGLLNQGIWLVVASVLVAAISFVKEMILAQYFGTSSASDAYTMAIQVPEILFAIVWETISAVTIPMYARELKGGGKKANKFYSNIFSVICIMALLVIVVLEFAGGFVLKIMFPGANSETLSLANSLLRWVVPMLFFEGIVRFTTGILSIYNKFALTKVLTAIRNIGIVVFLLLFSNKFGIFAAAIGLLTGIAIESFLCVIFTSRYERYSLTVDLKDENLRKILCLMLPLLLGIGARELNNIADKIMSSFFESGSISSINYATKLSSMIETCLLGNIAVLMYPKFSLLSADGKKEQLTLEYRKSVNILVLMSIPMLFGGCFLGNEIVSIAFERGAFDGKAVESVARFFAIYLLCTMFTAINGLSVRLFTANGDTKTPTYNAVIGVIVNIVLNIILSYFFGVIGLAIATLVASVVLCVRSYFLVRRKVFKFNIKPTVIVVSKSIIAGVIMLAGLFAVKIFICPDSLFDSLVGKIVYSGCCVIFGGIVYVLLLAIMRVDEIKLFFNRMKRKR